MHSLLEDLRHSARNLRRSPGYAITAGLALAIGIGANSALFTVVNSVLLRPLPYADSDRLVAVHESVRKWNMLNVPLSTLEYGAFRETARSYEGLGAYESVTLELSGVSPAETLSTVKMTAGLFETLGVQPATGRTFGAQEDFDGSDVALISYGLWSRRFGRDPAIIGRTLTLDRKPRTIIGVMPQSFVFPQRGPSDNNVPADVFVPMGFSALERQGGGPSLQKSVIGRLKPGVTVQAAASEASSIGPLLTTRLPAIYVRRSAAVFAFSVVPLRQEVTGNVSRVLWLLMGAVFLLLLIACANVANLTLARGAGRRHERAIRAALGASRAALVRYQLSESIVLAFGSGLFGLLLAALATSLLMSISPIQLPREQELRVNWPVIAFTFAIAAASALLSGLGAIFSSPAASHADGLRDSTRSTTAGRSRHWLLGTLASAQFALTVVLLIASGLMVRSLLKTIATDPGFRPEQAAAVTTHLPPSFYARAAQTRALYLAVARNAESEPGIKAAGIGTELPLGDWEKGIIFGEGASATADGSSGPIASQVWVTGHYLEALGVPLRRGRFFEDVEYRESREVVIINETLAGKLWPGSNAVGRRLRNSRRDWQTVVGVVGDIKEIAVNAAPVAQIFEPHSQLPDVLMEMTTIPFFKTLNLVSRSDNGPATQIRQLTDAIHRADPSLAISGATALGEIVHESGRSQRLDTFLIAAFGSVACLLAVMGVAGVLGYSVAERRPEIGIRMALGATPGAISGMILKRGLLLAAVGIAAGLAASFALARLLASFLYGVSAHDPLTFAVIPLALLATAALAAWLPAVRAARVDPLKSLRAE